MARRRKLRQRDTQLTFEALSIEGGLLSPEWLARVAQLTAGGQSESDYRIPKGLNLRDEIGRYWRIAQAHWADFARGRAPGAPGRALAESFVTALLREAFGFGSLVTTAPVVMGERTFPVGHLALQGQVPVVVAAPRPLVEAGQGSALDDLDPELGDGGRRRSPFGLAQEFLNAREEALWAIVSDGLTLRLCRDNASLTRPAWIEADLARIFGEERYADFAALWLLAHETRFGAPGRPATDSPLEAWRNAGREKGTRARGLLRDGVEEALVALGKGFLSHPENHALRKALHDGALARQELFQELLRLVYRLIFLLTVEERELLHPAGVPDVLKALYAQGYGMRRLRDRSVKRSAHDRFGDLWDALRIVLRGVAAGEPRLGLPALGGLFAPDQCPHLDAAKLENRWLLTAVFRLSWLKEDSGLSRVNWRDMGPEELGSVYESLLELVPVIPPDYRGFGFAKGDEGKGNARKTTGSYYTPDSLVQVLLDSALEPVVKDTVAAHPEDPVHALLALTVVDPACGSGHFLLAAARRLAVHVARLHARGTPSAAEYRHALRQVVSRCIFGVDLNPMAVELCRVALWMEAVEPGLPLSFLDSHIQCGNALLGTTPELMAGGIPDAAWEPIEGDDRKTASLLKKRNKAAAEGQRGLESLWSASAKGEAAAVRESVAALEAAPDADLAGVAGKEAGWEELQRSSAYRHQKFVADAWCAAFVWPKPALEEKKVPPVAQAAPTNDLWRQLRDGQGTAPALTVKTAEELVGQYQFFHWHLAFPQVHASGGFDLVLGNPPWEKVNLNQKEWFSARAPDIAAELNVATRSARISTLATSDPRLLEQWAHESRHAEGVTHFARASGRYPLCAHGDINFYALFAEANYWLVTRTGRMGCVLPSGLATDKATQQYFSMLMGGRNLVSMYEFENEGFFSAGKGHMLRFALITVSRGPFSGEVDLLFQGQALSELQDRERHFSLSLEDVALINPNSATCPIFRTRRDAELAKRIYRRVPIFWKEDGQSSPGPWQAVLGRTLHIGEDAHLFKTRADLVASHAKPRGNVFVQEGVEYVPLYEAKMMYQLDHRYGDVGATDGQEREHRLPEVDEGSLRDPAFAPLPFYWVERSEVDGRLDRRGWSRPWLMVWREITDARASLRTVVACVLPRFGVSHKLSLLLPAHDPTALAGMLTSFVLDYCARQKLGGISLTQFVFRQLPVLPPEAFREAIPWERAISSSEWVKKRVLELVYSAWDLEPFARDVGYDGPPFRWDADRRFLLRAELDAAFFYLYGISRDDADYILETFPIVRKIDEKAYGEFRTKRVILEIYDAMAAAIRTGTPYQTRLDPPPADPRCAHPSSSRSAHTDPGGEPSRVSVKKARASSPNPRNGKGKRP